MSNLDSATPAAAVAEIGTAERDSTTASVSALNGTHRCKKKKIKKNTTREQQELQLDLDSTLTAEAEGQVEAKGNEVEEQDATDAVASGILMEGTAKYYEEDSKVKVSLMPEKEANTTVVSDVVGASGHADINMDPINGDDLSSAQSKANDADVLLKNKDGNKGDKNCAENSVLLQESSARRKRRRGKRKWGSAGGGPGFSSDNGGVVAEHSLHSSANHGLSCICAPCLVEAHEKKIQNIYSPRGSLVRFQRKKLLILDLNGLLADINQDYHNAHLAHAKVRTKLVFRRPYCDDFLRFCFQNFELGIWSSRKRENVESVVDILMRGLKQCLLFCWDMSYCTVTGCKTIDNKDKPLVLKELKRVWNKDEPDLPWGQGEFSPSNTLLVDDSPYKALCNPPNTAIFPEPYNYMNQRDDYSLGPGGDLRVYLQRIAAADNVQNFVRDNPFGQKSITESDPNWNFYVKIVDKMEKQIVDQVETKIVDEVERSLG
ncbi:uncharacterized protein [Zea mays]|uniref:uncharacterized protein isoform X3 n=1 Tax=Zea mays TaxID=4577 RepID=UPI0004DEB612|nr:uncharacterized protein LOC103632363 isoform X3 [Zea mays]|eukprot:XP_008652403.1 uncharacterized protein LOC103632363 isoform X3 [Zea mays]